jgi:iron complex outermembrane recepter protein
MRRPVSATIVLLLAGSAVPALAQDIRVDVIGSNIRRPEGESTLPVQIITREEIVRTGAQTAAELLQFVSANNSRGAITVANVIGSPTNSVSTASLRGLGGQNTLVLLNGKRLTPSSGEVTGVIGVNLDSIPFAAIERVEVLKDGASAIYGSDAIAGVINFVLRQDFRGAEATLYYGAPTRGGGGEKWNAKGTVGVGDLAKDKYNVLFSANYQKAESLDQNKRSFSDSSVDVERGLIGVSGNTFPAHITTGDIGTPGFPNCSPGIYDPTLDPFFGMARCVFDPSAADGVNAIPKQDTTSFFASARWQFNPDWQLYGTAAYTKVDTRYVIQPTPISDQFIYGPNLDLATILLPPSSPYYPAALAEAAGVNGQSLNLRYRAYALGHRDTTDENEAFQGVAGIKGTAFNWEFDFDFVYSKNETKSRLNGGFALYSEVLPLLNSGRVNPFGPSTPEVQAELDAMQLREEVLRGESTSWLFEGKASSELFKLPAGSVAAAFGFQAGRQELEQRFHPSLQASDVTGLGGGFPNIDADRDYWAAFAEINIPIVTNLELNAVVRYDDFSDFGHTTNPKVSIRWNPVRQLLLRGSWGTGFVVPALTQAYGANSVGLSQPGLEDPLRCPTTQDENDCLNQFNVLFGGNANLQPQTSDQWTLGLVFEPLAGLSIAFDWFNIKFRNMFGNPFIQTILNNQDQYGHLITRGPVQPQFPTIPGPITLIDQRLGNIDQVNIAGWDVNIKATGPATDWGRFGFNLDGSYYTKYDVRNPDGTYTSVISNQAGAAVSGVSPRYKQYATVTWTRGPWSASLGNQYQSSYGDYGTDGDGNPRRVSSTSFWDFYGSYTGLKNWKFVLGVQNLFDRDPPFSNQQTTFQQGHDPTSYDARARFVYGSVTYSFQ